MSEQHAPEFEDRLRALLARAAEAIPTDSDITARVRQAPTPARHAARLSGTTGLRTMLSTLAAVLIVALLAGVLTFVHLGHTLQPSGNVTGKPTATMTPAPLPVVVPPACHMQPGNQPSAATTPIATSPGKPVDDSISIGRSSSVQGITITIDRAYADATQTVITYHMDTNINPPLPVLTVLIDGQGHRYASISGDWDIRYGGRVVFAPLPSDELGVPQQFTFITQQMQMADPIGPGALVNGPWHIRFRLTPVMAGVSVTLTNPPLTYHGLTIQPLQLDLAAAGGGIDGQAGGARLVVRVSGLAAGMHLSDFFMGFNTILALSGSAMGCGGGISELVLPGGDQITPGAIYPLSQAVPVTPAEQKAAQQQMVGSSGAVDLEVLYFTPIPLDSGIILYMDHVPAELGDAAKTEPIDGPWEYRLLPTS
jgi:hypothetical protein